MEPEIENITRDVALLKASGRSDWVLIDTPRQELDIIENAIVDAVSSARPLQIMDSRPKAMEAIPSQQQQQEAGGEARIISC